MSEREEAARFCDDQADSHEGALNCVANNRGDQVWHERVASHYRLAASALRGGGEAVAKLRAELVMFDHAGDDTDIPCPVWLDANDDEFGGDPECNCIVGLVERVLNLYSTPPSAARESEKALSAEEVAAFAPAAQEVTESMVDKAMAAMWANQFPVFNMDRHLSAREAMRAALTAALAGGKP